MGKERERISYKFVCVYVESNPDSIPVIDLKVKQYSLFRIQQTHPHSPTAYSIALLTNAANSSAFDPAIIVK